MNSSAKRVDDWLRLATKKLEQAGIGTARLDALVFLEDATDRDRSWLLAHPELECQGRTLTQLEEWIGRRKRHEPLSYIRGKTEFYDREFFINSDVLEPRPESETMIELLKTLLKTTNYKLKTTLVDLGTGSGCLAITAKLELPEIEVIATDIDPKCLQVARQNARKYGVKIKFVQGDLLQPIWNSEFGIRNSVLLCNLPYVPVRYKVNEAARHEPKTAIFGGKDGLDLYRRLFQQVANFSQPTLYILTESLPFQHKELAKIAQAASYVLAQTDDFIQVFEKVSSSKSQGLFKIQGSSPN